MDDTIRVYSGRTFSSEDIEIIKWVRVAYPKLSRHEFAGTVCELLGWITPAGRSKTVQCVALLEKLEAEGILELPPFDATKKKKRTVKRKEFEFDIKELEGEIGDYEPIKLVIAHPGEELKRWRAYVNKYHMLGDKQVFGSRLHYFVKSGDIELGCMQFSASSWSLEKRDKWLEWTADDRKIRLHLVINNSRFLIFPWVNIRNLASKTLSLAARQIQKDWLREFCYEPVLLETFVDRSFFKGVCYKAANWVYLGDTKGTGRTGRKGMVSVKAIFMYPLQDDYRSVLTGEKPFKAVDPE